MRRSGIRAILCLGAAAGSISLAVPGAPAVSHAADAGLLATSAPDGRALTPAGRLVPTKGSFPAGILLADGGRTAVVADASKFADLIETYPAAAPAAGGASVPVATPVPLPGELPDVQSGALSSGGRGIVYAAGGASGTVRAFQVTGPAPVQVASYQVGAVNGLTAGDHSGDIGDAVAVPGTQTLIASEPFSSSGGKGTTVVRYDLATRAVTGRATVGAHPAALAVAPPMRGHRTAPAAGMVAVASQDAGTVSVLDPATMAVVHTVATGREPSALAFTSDGRRLLVVDSLDDEVTIIDTARWRVIQRVRVHVLPGLGASPNAIALAPGDRRAYVTLGADNAVAVLARGRRSWAMSGLIPTARYPTGIAVDAAHRQLLVTAGKAGAATLADIPANLGALEQIPLPSAPTLAADTLQVRADDAVAPVACSSSPLRAIKHIVLIIRENKTYDAEFGDMPAGDPAYLMYGRSTTPNSHALADRFALLEDFSDDEEVSDTGHQVIMGGVANDWVQRQSEQAYNLGGAQRPGSELGNDDDVLWAPNGYLFDSALAHGITFRDYGEFYRRDQRTDAAISPALDAHIVHDFPGFGFDPAVPDTRRAAFWVGQFEQDVSARSFPQLEVIYLPEDHTTTVDDGAPPAQVQVADNDRATGQIVDALSHSPYWSSSAVFVTEDDPQDGMDHIDPHRSLALVVGPHVRPAVRTAVPYDQLSILRTIEMILGLPPLTEHDATARPMTALFDPSSADTAPYSALVPQPPLPLPSTLGAVTALARRDFGPHPTAAAEFDSHSRDEFALQWLSTHGRPFSPTARVPGPGPGEVRPAARRRLLMQGETEASASAATGC